MPVLVSSPRFIGRREELGVLEAALDRAQRGEGSLVLVSGESGIGKSRLISEFAAGARNRGATVLIGECLELAGGQLPYAPIASALRSMERESGASRTDTPGAQSDDELAVLLAELTPGRNGVLDDGHSVGAQARLFERLLAMLSNLGRRAPVALVIEDFHWADRSTGDFLSFLVRNARRERLVLVISYRSDELRRRHPLRPLVLELERSGRTTRAQLQPFDRGEITDQLAAILDAPPKAELIDRLIERSEGNPFFTEELLAASGVPGSAVPESLRDALLLRVEECSAATQDVLRIAAVAGRTVDHGLLAGVAEMSETELTEALQEAVSRYLIVSDPGASSYSFRHALLREAVYADLLPGQRRSLHVKLALALAGQPGSSENGAGSAAELAYHWHAAGELDQALIASVRAGMEAGAVYAHAEAVGHYTRALEIWDRAAVSQPPLDRLTVIRRAADEASLSGDPDRATAAARAALGLVDEHADPVTAALLHERLGRFLWTAGKEGDALGEYRRAVELMPADPPSAERALVLAAEGQALMLRGLTVDSKALCEEAIAIARRVGARAVEANALNTIGANHTGEGDDERAVQAIVEARRIAIELGDVEEVARSYVNGSDALDEAGRMPESIALTLEGIRVAHELGLERAFGDFLRAELAARMLRVARWSEADELLQELSEGAPTGLSIAMLHSTRGLLAAEQGQFAAAERDLERARELFSGMHAVMWLGPLQIAQATMELWADRPEAAAVTVREGDSLDQESGRVFFTARLYELGARAAADIAARAPADDDRDARLARGARALLELLDELLEGFKAGTPPPSASASRAACAAELSRMTRSDGAAAWARAKRSWEQVGDRYQAAYAAFRQAETLFIDEGDAGPAPDLVREAHAVAARLGARPLRALIEGLAQSMELELAETPLAPTPSQATPSVPTATPEGAATPLPSGVVTVLFSDIENSTLLLDLLGDEPFMRLLHDHNRIIRQQLARFGGREIKTAGDSFMVAFGQPRRALACAVAIQRSVVEVKPAIRLRIGLHAGETIQQDDDLFGRHVVIAARVAALADGGEILVTSLVRELAQGATGLHFGARREHALKGLTGLQPVYPLRWNEPE
jgi:class 3 adenylate cyclase/tetratricopeptide (TPR) repeat protein